MPVVDSYWPQPFFPPFLLHVVVIQLQQLGPAVLDQDHIVLYSIYSAKQIVPSSNELLSLQELV